MINLWLDVGDYLSFFNYLYLFLYYFCYCCHFSCQPIFFLFLFRDCLLKAHSLSLSTTPLAHMTIPYRAGWLSPRGRPQEEVSVGVLQHMRELLQKRPWGFLSPAPWFWFMRWLTSFLVCAPKVWKAITTLNPKPSSRPFLCITSCSPGKLSSLILFSSSLLSDGMGMAREANQENRNYGSVAWPAFPKPRKFHRKSNLTWTHLKTKSYLEWQILFTVFDQLV